MKTVLAVALAVVVMMWTSTAVRAWDEQKADEPTTQVCTLKVSGMTCAGCEAAVRMAARSVVGVTEVKVSYAKGRAEVTYHSAKTTPDAIAKAITDKSGFKAETTEPTPKK